MNFSRRILFGLFGLALVFSAASESYCQENPPVRDSEDDTSETIDLTPRALIPKLASFCDPENMSRTEDGDAQINVTLPLKVPSTNSTSPIIPKDMKSSSPDEPRYVYEVNGTSDTPLAFVKSNEDVLLQKKDAKIESTPKGKVVKNSSTKKPNRKPGETLKITDAQSLAENETHDPSHPTKEEKSATTLRVRDEHAARLLETIRQGTASGVVGVRAIDDATSTLVPARVLIQDITAGAAGSPLPLGTWCEGVTQSQIISGTVRVEVSRGRFHPLYIKGFSAEAGVTSQLDAVLSSTSKVMNFPARGWYLADFDLGIKASAGEQSVWLGDAPTLETMALAARAENVQIVGVQIPEDTDTKEWLATLNRLSCDGLLLIPVFSGPRHGLHGVGLGIGVGVNSWKEIPREVSAPEKSIQEAFEEIRASGGLAAYKDILGSRSVNLKKDIFPIFPNLKKNNYFGKDTGEIRLYAATELPYDTVTGGYDLLAFDGSEVAERLWFNVLQEGFPITVIGASGGSLESGTPPVGQTFVQIDGALTQEAVLNAVKKGRTSVSFGPAVFAKILERDMGPGSILPSDGRALTLQIQAYSTMRHSAQIEKVEVIRNGIVVETHTPLEGQSQVPDLRISIRETATAWYVVRVTEKTGATELKSFRSKAWTSPIFFRGASFAPTQPIRSQISGILSCGLTPIPGTVTVIAPGVKPVKFKTDAMGRYKINAPANATLVFAAENCDPFSVKIFEHPRVQKAMGALQSGKEGTLEQQFSKISLFPTWNLLLSELNWDIALHLK